MPHDGHLCRQWKPCEVISLGATREKRRKHRVKVILSRKGFDSGYGGWASPILLDGRMLSLPIPASNGVVSYSDLSAGDGVSYLDIMRQLRHGHQDRFVLSHKTWLPSRQGICLLYTSDAADDLPCVDLGGRR